MAPPHAVAPTTNDDDKCAPAVLAPSAADDMCAQTESPAGVAADTASDLAMHAETHVRNNEVFEYTPPSYFDAESRVPAWLQPWIADAFMCAIYHYNLWAVPVVAFFYYLYQSGHGVIALALIAIYIPRFLDGAERTAHGRPWEWFWGTPLWRLCSEFLGITIVREQELEPAKKYIFGFHPHGILILSRVATYGGVWEKVFPGISARLLGASIVFQVPLARDICLWMNAVNASRSTAEKVLKSGKSVLVYPGGIPEIFLTEPNSTETQIMLSQRLGFVKLAIRHGAELVPTFAFGEKWLFNVWTPSKNVVALVRKVLKIPIIVFWGRFLWMPKRLPAGKKFGLVYGKPIATEQHDDPSDAQVQAVHTQYVAEIARIFEQYKGKFGYDADETLTIL